jgi:hypothetical protein
MIPAAPRRRNHPGVSAFDVQDAEEMLQGEFPQFAVIRLFSVPF